ncbi:MAG: hypothetical protein AB8I08_07480 [Sandaracinaceae bacterium]
MPRLRRLLCALALTAALPSCVSEDDLRREWSGYVETVDECTDAADCTLVSPGCPLGCYDAVRAESLADATAEADRLVGTYEGTGRTCEYDCPEAPRVLCAAGRCCLEGQCDPAME